ncbi:MAG TPA: alpha/beta hydrolase [Clostridiaceae bacterium]|nr:alpha/beta hydrolase [Clostridiaceae bacterium]
MFLDLYLPTNPAFFPIPVVVFFHGGGFVSGNKAMIRHGTTEHTMMFLRDTGFAVASVQYRFVDGTTVIPKSITDARDAIRFLKKVASDYDLDRERVAAWGSSAGASLALTAAYLKEDLTPPDVEGDGDLNIFSVININAATDLYRSLYKEQLDDDFSEYYRDHLSLYYGKEDPQAIAQIISPYHLASSAAPPTLSMHGSKDKIVDMSESVRLHEKLTELGVPTELYLLPDSGHSLLPVKPDEEEEITRRTIDFLLKYMP